MSTNKKINETLENISSSVKTYVTKFTDLCESEIEKLFFVNLLSYLFASKYRIETGFEDSGDVPYHNLFFQGFDALYENATNDDCNPALYLKGIKFIDEDNMSKHSRGKGIFYKNEYSIYPQYCVEMENSNYRIDIAIICQLYEDRLLKN